MSRRHRGRPHHHAPTAPEAPRRSAGPDARPTPAPEPGRAASAIQEAIEAPSATLAAMPDPASERGASADRSAQHGPAGQHAPGPQNGERTGQCTAPQLRRFIKSRPYVPMHELRRRFSINGEDDEVTPVRLEPGLVYVGLPSHEGRLLGELLRSGEIGYELSLDPRTPIVIGVYPMRPIPRT
jgi:hypothetical protein